MSAARAIPITATEWSVTIDNTFTPKPPAFIIEPGDTVKFINNSGSDINIQFDPTSQPEPMFSNTPVIPKNGGTYVATTSPGVNGSELYSIYVGTTKQNGGPYAIQVGTGPLYVEVTNAETAPDPAVIPVGGTLRIIDSANNPWTVGWKQGGNPCPNPFNPPLTTVGNHQVTANTGKYDYTLSSGGPILGNGGGTIIVSG
jgi:hypothetical protein